jgi:hypothetical protein
MTIIASLALQTTWADRVEPSGKAWKFVSIPDFLNNDILYPQQGWEETLDYVLNSIKKERPDFLLIPGDLVQGRWWSEKDIRKYADIYYKAWKARLKAHSLKYYTAIGDHELGDLPGPKKAKQHFSLYKQMFRKYLKMPENGPDNMIGTAFYFTHKNCLFIAVDVFEQSEKGDILIQVGGKQIKWLKKVMSRQHDVKHVMVMGHVPILGPVKVRSSSGLMLKHGERSPLWRAMAKYKVDLYLCGEVHEINCTRKDGITQVAHGGLFGFTPTVNYLVATVSSNAILIEIKEIEIQNIGGYLPQQGWKKWLPREKIQIPEKAKQCGFQTIGSAVIKKTGSRKALGVKKGCFSHL